MSAALAEIEVLRQSYTSETNPRRFDGVVRNYTVHDVQRLRGTVRIQHTLAEMGARRLWDLLHSEDYVHALGALTGNQAVQMVRAGLQAIYVSGWQVAADANSAGQMYPDQSLYPVDSVPNLVRKINAALQRADQIDHAEGKIDRNWYAPMIADAEAGFGGPLNAHELMKSMIDAGAAGVHFEDQLAAEKKCGHMGGKVLVPTSQFIRTLQAARLAADVMDVPTILIARTDAQSAKLLTSDVNERDHPFIDRESRTAEGFYRLKGGNDCAIARAKAYAPYADLLWCETSTPDMSEAKRFAEEVRKDFPNKLLAYNCSPSFNWKKKLDDFVVFAGVGQVAHFIAHPLAFPLAAVLMGIVEAHWGRTPGKRLMGLCTLDNHGTKPTWRRAITRSFLKLWGPILVDFMATFLSGRFVNVAAGLVLATWLASFLVALGRRNLAFHDRACRTQVVSSMTPRAA